MKISCNKKLCFTLFNPNVLQIVRSYLFFCLCEISVEVPLTNYIDVNFMGPAAQHSEKEKAQGNR